ncbi:hypothetical protein [Thermithiobacillus plumbiphilus]|uniref:Uncharacterized protein n=1 Tax=Thermithiobacillus plumbiphilus TaxID=1729899 RepID=A0ABU9D725_9PROT
MTYAELLNALQDLLDYPILLVNEDPGATLAAAQAGQLDDKIVEKALVDIYNGNDCTDLDCALERHAVINSLGQLRLQTMRDDADPKDFRKVLMMSQQIDKAFDNEILTQKR